MDPARKTVPMGASATADALSPEAGMLTALGVLVAAALVVAMLFVLFQATK